MKNSNPKFHSPSGEDAFVALKRELQPGERILWQSRQNPRFFGSGSIATWLFAIPWTAFALFWMGMAWFLTRMGGEPVEPIAYLFPLFGLPFVLIGLGMFVKPVLNYFGSKYTVFAVTNQRVIRLFKRKGVLTQSVSPKRIGKVKVLDEDDGSGTIQFRLKGKAGDYEPKGMRFVMRDVDNVDQAKRYIRDLAQTSKD